MSSAVDRPGDMRAWLILEGDAADHLPAAWQKRSRPGTLIPLLPEEARGVLAEGRAEPTLDPADEVLMKLSGKGLSTGEIARTLATPQRSVQRRLARLRRSFGFRSNEQLAAFAAQLAIGGSGDRMGTAHPNADVPAPADVAGTSEVPAKPSTRAPHPTPRRQP